jgi:hypothetical protein
MAFALLVTCLSLLFTNRPAEAACEWEGTDPTCNDGDLLNGYWWRGGWVPGVIDVATHWRPAPQFTSGRSVYYAEGVMEATARFMGFDLDEYVDGVAMMSCADVGQTVWIHRSWGVGWEGPYLVVDCAEWDDHWPVTVFRGEVIEVGYKTAKRWGMIDANEYARKVFVWKGVNKPQLVREEATKYVDWFLETATFLPDTYGDFPRRPVFYPPHRWYMWGEWVDFVTEDTAASGMEPAAQIFIH